MVGVEHVGGVEPQLTFSKSESELLRMMRAVKEVTDHFHFFDRLFEGLWGSNPSVTVQFISAA